MNSDLTPAAVRTLVDTKLAQTGEKERLKDLLRSRLTESGWREDMKQQIKEYINKKEGNVTMDELVRECGTIGVDKVPPQVKQELLQHIRTTLQKIQDDL